jgi:hypothetical protein
MFKNYMYNDLNITKEDIEEWTKEAVKEVAQNHIENHIDEWKIRNLVSEGIHNVVKRISPTIIWENIKHNYDIIVAKKGEDINPCEHCHPNLVFMEGVNYCSFCGRRLSKT